MFIHDETKLNYNKFILQIDTALIYVLGILIKPKYILFYKC